MQTIPRLMTKLLLCGALAACAGKTLQPGATLYRCDNGTEFSVLFKDDRALLDGSASRDVLDRDAGGVGEQTVYSSPRMRAEFGLGPTGSEAVLRFPPGTQVLRCARG
jgi:hypothetical protein